MDVLVWVGIGLVAVWYLIAWFLQRSLVFPGFAAGAVSFSREPPEVRGLERVWHETRRARVEGWFLPGDGVSPDAPGPAVIFAHGNAETIDEWARALAHYRRLGVSVLLVEYRGYGRSKGRPSQRRIVRDFVWFRDWLVARPDVDASRIVYHGRSLGGGVVTALAKEHAPAAMVLQSTFRSITSFMIRFAIPPFLVRDPFPSARTLRDLHVPVLIVHGTLDETVPFHHAKHLVEVSVKARLVTYDRGHNDLPMDGEYWREVEHFLREADILPGPPV